MKSSKGGTVDSDVKTMLAGVANALVAATYGGTRFRTLSDWKGQYEYIVGNTGFVPAGWLLVAITAIQVSSVAIVVPASCCPQMAKPIIGVCCALGMTVLLQPLLYNLLELSQNVTILLVCMAFAQLGALGLIICESHKVDVASKAASSRSTTKVRGGAPLLVDTVSLALPDHHRPGVRDDLPPLHGPPRLAGGEGDAIVGHALQARHASRVYRRHHGMARLQDGIRRAHGRLRPSSRRSFASPSGRTSLARARITPTLCASTSSRR